MTDETKDQDLELELNTTDTSPELEQTTESTEESSETVNEARKFGHLTKEEWEAQGRDPSKWKSPDEFVKYGREYTEVKDLIKSLRQQNQQQTKQIDMLVDYHKQTMEQAVQQAKKELENQLTQAKNLGDIEAVEKLTQAKVLAEAKEQRELEQAQAQERNRVDQEFLSRNRHWFNESHPELVQKAQQISVEIAGFYPTISYAELVRRTEERLKFDHPEINSPSSPSRPQITISDSNVNKSAAGQNPIGEDRLYRTLSNDQRAEFNAVKKMVERVPGIKYSINEYLTSTRGKSNG